MRVKIPTKLSEVSIGTFMRLQKIFKDPAPEGVGVDEWNITKSVKAICTLTGLQEWQVNEMPLDEVKRILKVVDPILNPQFPTKVQNKVKIAGKVYKANLLVNELSAGQYIDISEFAKDVENNIHKLMATVYLPTKRNWYGRRVIIPYSGKDHEERAMLFKTEMPISVAYPCALFFCVVSSRSTAAIQSYFQQKGAMAQHTLIQMLQKQLRTLQKRGAGTQPLTT